MHMLLVEDSSVFCRSGQESYSELVRVNIFLGNFQAVKKMIGKRMEESTAITT